MDVEANTVSPLPASPIASSPTAASSAAPPLATPSDCDASHAGGAGDVYAVGSAGAGAGGTEARLDELKTSGESVCDARLTPRKRRKMPGPETLRCVLKWQVADTMLSLANMQNDRYAKQGGHLTQQLQEVQKSMKKMGEDYDGQIRSLICTTEEYKSTCASKVEELRAACAAKDTEIALLKLNARRMETTIDELHQKLRNQQFLNPVVNALNYESFMNRDSIRFTMSLLTDVNRFVPKRDPEGGPRAGFDFYCNCVRCFNDGRSFVHFVMGNGKGAAAGGGAAVGGGAAAGGEAAAGGGSGKAKKEPCLILEWLKATMALERVGVTFEVFKNRKQMTRIFDDAPAMVFASQCDLVILDTPHMWNLYFGSWASMDYSNIPGNQHGYVNATPQNAVEADRSGPMSRLFRLHSEIRLADVFGIDPKGGACGESDDESESESEPEQEQEQEQEQESDSDSDSDASSVVQGNGECCVVYMPCAL